MTNSLAGALALSDEDLLRRIDSLAGTERETTADLVAHLAALDLRPSLYAARGYGSLFAYCTQALRLSEDAACNRIDAARVCRRFPIVLDLLAAGSISLSCVRLLKPHLTPANYQAVLARATSKSYKEVQALTAELAPQPDVAASVRRLPVRKTVGATDASGPSPASASDLRDPAILGLPTSVLGATESPAPGPVGRDAQPAALAGPPSVPNLDATRALIRALAPQRYRVQFTVGQEAHDKLRRVQALLRREIPTGDPGLIFEQALDLLLAKVEKAKLGATTTARPVKAIRRVTDKTSRHIPADVKRAVWLRDRGHCAFVALTGVRCTEHTFLELHHILPFALNGPATVANIALRCRRHNQYEAELAFGTSRPSTATSP
jgi:hypothetical protein